MKKYLIVLICLFTKHTVARARPDNAFAGLVY
jgi:hypothetical protein